MPTCQEGKLEGKLFGMSPEDGNGVGMRLPLESKPDGHPLLEELMGVSDRPPMPELSSSVDCSINGCEDDPADEPIG